MGAVTRINKSVAIGRIIMAIPDASNDQIARALDALEPHMAAHGKLQVSDDYPVNAHFDQSPNAMTDRPKFPACKLCGVPAGAVHADDCPGAGMVF